MNTETTAAPDVEAAPEKATAPWRAGTWWVRSQGEVPYMGPEWCTVVVVALPDGTLAEQIPSVATTPLREGAEWKPADQGEGEGFESPQSTDVNVKLGTIAADAYAALTWDYPRLCEEVDDMLADGSPRQVALLKLAVGLILGIG